MTINSGKMMAKKYEVHTYNEMKVASFVYAKSKEEAIKIACKKDTSSFLKDEVLDISTIDVKFAFEC